MHGVAKRHRDRTQVQLGYVLAAAGVLAEGRAAGIWADEAVAGLGRIVALHHRSSASHQIREEIRRLCS